MSSFCPLLVRIRNDVILAVLVRIRNVAIMSATSKDWTYISFCLSLARIINVVIIFLARIRKKKTKCV